MREMTDNEVREAYPQLIEFLGHICQPILSLPLPQMAAINEHFQTIAPLLEPTAYQRGGRDNLHDQRVVIDAAVKLQAALHSLDPGRAASRNSQVTGTRPAGSEGDPVE